MVRDYRLDQGRIKAMVREEYYRIKKQQRDMQEGENPCEACPLRNDCLTEYTDVRNQCVAYKELIKY